VFDENGKFLDQWDFGPRPPMNIHSIYTGARDASGACTDSPPTKRGTSGQALTGGLVERQKREVGHLPRAMIDDLQNFFARASKGY